MADGNRTKLVTVSCPSHGQVLIGGLWRAYLAQNKTDLTINCNEHSIHLHRLIMDIFLKPMAILGKTESANDDHSYIMATETDPEMEARVDHDHLHFSALVEFMYKGTVAVPREYLIPLAKLANDLGFQMLVKSAEAAVLATVKQISTRTKANPIIAPPKRVETENWVTVVGPPLKHGTMIYRKVPKNIYNSQKTNHSLRKSSQNLSTIGEANPTQPVAKLTEAELNAGEAMPVAPAHETEEDILSSVILPRVTPAQTDPVEDDILSSVILPRLSPAQTDPVEIVVETSSAQTIVHPAISNLMRVKCVSIPPSKLPSKPSRASNGPSIVQTKLKPRVTGPTNKEYVHLHGNTGSVIIDTETEQIIGVTPTFESDINSNTAEPPPPPPPNEYTIIDGQPRGQGTKLKTNHARFDSRPFRKCRHCAFQTKLIDLLEQHERKHDPDSTAPKFPCKYCGIVFVIKCHLINHVCNDGQCPYCPQKFDRSQHLYQKHLARHGPDGTMLLCDMCPESFPDVHQLVLHKTNHRLHNCEHCEFSTYARREWRRHVKIIHGVRFNTLPAQESACLRLDCPLTFSSRKKMFRHVKAAHPCEKLFVCPHCGIKEGTNSGLRSHLKWFHTDGTLVKTNACSICGFRTMYPAALKRHMIIHSDLKQFACNMCDKHFKSEFYLRMHVRRHERKGSKSFVCKICFKAYDQNQSLKEHLIKHFTEKEYKCNLCSKAFFTSYQLARHLKVHQKQSETLRAISKGGRSVGEIKRKSKRSQAHQKQGASPETKSEGSSKKKRKSKQLFVQFNKA